MEPTLVVIGVSFRSAELAMRERFVLNSAQRSVALSALEHLDAIDEVIVLSNRNRTEFLVWTQDACEAANSVLRFLSRSTHLKLQEWSYFYRLVGDAALAHVFLVASGADSSSFGEPEATNSVLAAWQQAQRAGTAGRFLDALMAKAFSVTGRVRRELGASSNLATVSETAVAVCREALGDLSCRSVVILGAGQMARAAVREFQSAGIGEITIVNRSWDRGLRLARRCKVKAAHAETLWEQVLWADAVVSTISQQVLLKREAFEAILRERKNKRIVLIDIAVPRTIDSRTRTLDGVTALDLDDLCRALDQSKERCDRLPVAERIVAEEAVEFRNQLQSESILPTISAIRERLNLSTGNRSIEKAFGAV